MSGVFEAVGKVFNAVLSVFIPTPKGTHQKLGDIAQQTAKEGEPRLIVWGRVRPVGGNVMHSSEPKIVRVKQDSGGKGGGGSESTTEKVYRTYAIEVCEGPITGFMRIWRNNKLVYDARPDEDTGLLSAWGTKNNGQFTKRASLYLGDWDQMPSAVLEAIWGAGEVPAYRGTAYMVIDNEELTDLGGAVPQYLFEVERAEGIPLTSRPYALDVLEGVQGAGATLKYSPAASVTEAVEGASALVTHIELRSSFQTYDEYQPEAVDGVGALITGIAHNADLIRSYTDGDPEAVDAVGATITAIALRNLLITYDEYQPEAVDGVGALITGIALT